MSRLIICIISDQLNLIYNLTNHYIGSIDNMDNPAYLPQLTNLFTDSVFWSGGHRIIARHICGSVSANVTGLLNYYILLDFQYFKLVIGHFKVN